MGCLFTLNDIFSLIASESGKTKGNVREKVKGKIRETVAVKAKMDTSEEWIFS